MGLGKIAIIGAGAVGCYYGGRLAEAGEDVTFLLRSDYNHIKQHGLKVSSVAGDFHLKNIQIAQNSEDVGPVDLVILAWKTTSNIFAKEVISPLLGPHTAIITLQNGLGNCEHLSDLFGSERIMAGLCFVCINKVSPGVISHTASGLIRVGDFMASKSNRLSQLIKALNKAKIPCEKVDSLEKAFWMKLIWNIPFNGLAITEGGVDTATLLTKMGLEPVIRSIMNEVRAIAAALGHDIPRIFIDQEIEKIRDMGHYCPSSMLDFVNGRKIEYDAIWKIPHNIAHDLNVDIPHTDRLIKKLTEIIICQS